MHVTQLHEGWEERIRSVIRALLASASGDTGAAAIKVRCTPVRVANPDSDEQAALRMVPVSVAELKEHIGFLRAVHVASGPGEKSLYADGARLRTAVRTYCAWLASEAACAGGPGTVLVTRAPPLEVAWIWHVHRLATVEYASSCAALGAHVSTRRAKRSAGRRSAAC